MRRRQVTHKPSQSYEIDLLVDGACKLGRSEHVETAKRAEYWTFTSAQETTRTQPNDRHYFGMLRPKEEYGVCLQAADAAIAEEALAQAAEADGLPADYSPGHENDPLVRIAVERHAVKAATA